MRHSDQLRPAWAGSACSGRSLPLRAVRLTFPSLLCHTFGSCMPRPLPRRLTSPCRQLAPPTRPPVYGRACPGRGLPHPESAITTRPNHPLPRQDLHLQVRQSPKAAHRHLLFRDGWSVPGSGWPFKAKGGRVVPWQVLGRSAGLLGGRPPAPKAVVASSKAAEGATAAGNGVGAGRPGCNSPSSGCPASRATPPLHRFPWS